MINRELIRLKLVQVLYSYHQRGLHNPDVAEKELLLSLDKAYDLYNYMLLLLVETSRMSVRMYEMRKSRSRRLSDGEQWSRKFIENRFILQLESNRQLRDYCDEHAIAGNVPLMVIFSSPGLGLPQARVIAAMAATAKAAFKMFFFIASD